MGRDEDTTLTSLTVAGAQSPQLATQTTPAIAVNATPLSKLSMCGVHESSSLLVFVAVAITGNASVIVVVVGDVGVIILAVVVGRKEQMLSHPATTAT